MARLLLNPRDISFGDDNILLHGHARRHFAQAIHAPLSIKSVIRGEGRWCTTEGNFLVDPSILLVVNEDQEYSLTIDSREPVETLCLFFAPDFSGDAFRTAQLPGQRLLDDPFAVTRVTFAERAHAADSPLGQRMRSIQAAASLPTDPLWLDAQLFQAAQNLADLVGEERAKTASLPAVKASTREELFRRVSRAKACLDAGYDAAVNIEQAARSAFLSPHHFHRVFTQCFGITPHRYIVEKRLARADYLLRTTRLPVIEICAAVGFQSLGSFSMLFRRRFGITPARARN